MFWERDVVCGGSGEKIGRGGLVEVGTPSEQLWDVCRPPAAICAEVRLSGGAAALGHPHSCNPYPMHGFSVDSSFSLWWQCSLKEREGICFCLSRE